MSGERTRSRTDYAGALDRLLTGLRERQSVPRLLLHACCAPCSSYCLEYLREFFDITVFFYNPNLTEAEEYARRAAEEKRLIAAYNAQVESGDFTGMRSDASARRIDWIEGAYRPEDFLSAAKGLEECPEGGARCLSCFRLRLSESARVAKAHGFDFFTTTLTISPLKSADALNGIGQEAGARYGVSFLPSDFKKKGGYQRSVELSKQFSLYRQDYCGCVFSRAERERARSDA